MEMFAVIETIFSVINFSAEPETFSMSLLWKGWILFCYSELLLDELTF